jgi:hypothetical protein
MEMEKVDEKINEMYSVIFYTLKVEIVITLFKSYVDGFSINHFFKFNKKQMKVLEKEFKEMLSGPIWDAWEDTGNAGIHLDKKPPKNFIKKQITFYLSECPEIYETIIDNIFN